MHNKGMIHVILVRKKSNRHYHQLHWRDPVTGNRRQRSTGTRNIEVAKSIRFHLERKLRQEHGHEKARRRLGKDKYYQRHRGERRHGYVFRDRRWVKDPRSRRLAQLFLRWQREEKLTPAEIARRCWCERIDTRRRLGKAGAFIEWTTRTVRWVMQEESKLQELEKVSGPIYPQELVDGVVIKGRLHTF